LVTHPQIEIQSAEQSGSAVLTVSGEVDLATAPALQTALLAMMERGSARVIVDMAEVTFMDSSGLSALLAARDAGGEEFEMVLVVGPGMVRRLLDTTAIGTLFTVVDTLDGALS
jgi:anti-sigma B factor antagonist